MHRTRLNQLFANKKFDVLISLSEQTRIWYADIVTSDGYIFIEKDKATLLVDGRYIELAQKTAKNVDVQLLEAGSLKKYTYGKQEKWKTIGIESEYLTVAQLNVLKTLFPKSKFVEVNAKDIRIIKCDKEVAKVQKAATITLNALKKLEPFIKPGISEKSLEAKLLTFMLEEGADKNSFDTIVVSGPRGALPHGTPSSKILQDGELVTVDCGVSVDGYVSDITRTFRCGNVTNEKLLEIEEILRAAQKAGIEAVKPGITTYEIDKICRDYITERGYGKYFVHSTGHGLGIDVHETPNVSASEANAVVLEPGMIITVEPGIYIEDLGGIRVEDDILVTDSGYKQLSL